MNIERAHVWLLVAVVWASAVVGFKFVLPFANLFAGFGIDSKWMNPRIASLIVLTLGYLLYFGWLLPLVASVWLWVKDRAYQH